MAMARLMSPPLSGLSDKRGPATNFAALLDNSDDDEKSAHENDLGQESGNGPEPGLKHVSEFSSADDEPALLIKKKKRKSI